MAQVLPVPRARPASAEHWAVQVLPPCDRPGSHTVHYSARREACALGCSTSIRKALLCNYKVKPARKQVLTRGRGWPVLLSPGPSVHFLSLTWRKLRRKNNVTGLQGSQYFMM